MDSQTSLPHAVLVSGPGFGHVQGCVLLAKSLISVGFSVTLACFARCYSTHASGGRIKPPHPSVRLEIVPDGLSPEAANYTDLFVTTSAMREGLEQLIQTLADEHNPATCIISDSLMGWTQDVANKFGVPRVDYWTSTATSYLLILALPELISRGYVCTSKGLSSSAPKSKNPVYLDNIPGLPRFPLDELPKELRFADADTDPLVQTFITAAVRAKDAQSVLIHSVYDLEGESFEALKELGMEAYAIGPLLHHHDAIDNNTSASLTWLDRQAKSSVIYVSFGSNAMLSDDEISELAHGLAASGQAFLWVIRSDQKADLLPPGFQSRTADRGLIVPWAPQLAVLAHPALGGFLSHCGWNSTLESLWMGVPMLTCPYRADQLNNSRRIAQDWGVGIELERTEKEGAFTRQHVEVGVRALIGGVPGQQARTKAMKLSEVLRKAPIEGGHSHSNLLKFASDMKKKATTSDGQ